MNTFNQHIHFGTGTYLSLEMNLVNTDTMYVCVYVYARAYIHIRPSIDGIFFLTNPSMDQDGNPCLVIFTANDKKYKYDFTRIIDTMKQLVDCRLTLDLSQVKSCIVKNTKFHWKVVSYIGSGRQSIRFVELGLESPESSTNWNHSNTPLLLYVTPINVANNLEIILFGTKLLLRKWIGFKTDLSAGMDTAFHFDV